MINVIIVHGFNDSSEGSNNVDKLKPILKQRGYNADTTQGDYGRKLIFGAWFNNEKVAQKLIVNHKPGNIYIGYSNGCSIIARAIDLGLSAEHCIFIHPALYAYWEPTIREHIKRIDVFYSEKDLATSSAWLLRKLSTPLNLLRKIYWGGMGNLGAKANNPIFHNFNDKSNHFDWAKSSVTLTYCIHTLGKV